MDIFFMKSLDTLTQHSASTVCLALPAFSAPFFFDITSKIFLNSKLILWQKETRLMMLLTLTTKRDVQCCQRN